MTPETRLLWAHDPEVRLRIEAHLDPVLREALDHLIRLTGIDPESWIDVPTLRVHFATAAAWEIVRHERARGDSLGGAILTASVRLGIPDGTVRSWITRWRSAA